MLRGAIFDMDGVLVDNMRVHMEAFAAIARRYGVGVNTYTILGMAGKGIREIFRLMFPAEVIDRVGVEALGAEKEALYREMYAPRLAPAPGLIEFLEGLRSSGVKTAIGSSAPTVNVDFVLDGLDIRRYFDAVVNIDMVKRAKPDPEIYLRALSELGLEAGECLVFEDAIAGVQAAHAAGIRVVAISTTIDVPILAAEPGVSLVASDFTSLNFDKVNDLIDGN
jgi:beta-phosphoglucomutase family hydrolase